MQNLTVKTKEGQRVHIESEDLVMVIGHNDVGVSVDYYYKQNLESGEPFHTDTIWFDDLQPDTDTRSGRIKWIPKN
jgi:hypothetical protein